MSFCVYFSVDRVSVDFAARETDVHMKFSASLQATGKMRMCGRADLRILERVRVKIMDLD